MDAARLLFGDVEVVPGAGDGKAEFITPLLPEKSVTEAMASLPGRVESRIRMLD